MLGLSLAIPSARRVDSESPTNAPVNTSAPELSSTSPVVGDTVECSYGVWSNRPLSFSFQWLRDGTPIEGATAKSYVVTEDDVDAALSCEVTATNAIDDSDPEESNATDPIPEPA